MTYVSLFLRSDIVSSPEKSLTARRRSLSKAISNLFLDVYMNKQWRNPVYRLL